MKLIVKICFLFLISGITFWSCSSKLTIAKRHYSRGYYVAHITGKPNTVNVHKKNTQISGKSYRDKSPETRIGKTGVTKETNISNTLTANNTTIHKNQTYQTLNVKAEKPYKPSLSIKQLSISTPLQKINRARLSEKSDSKHSDREGLSLFWLVIVIILILWFFGYIAGWGGTGGLINLLLLVALILLILWLLRII